MLSRRDHGVQLLAPLTNLDLEERTVVGQVTAGEAVAAAEGLAGMFIAAAVIAGVRPIHSGLPRATRRSFWLNASISSRVSGSTTAGGTHLGGDTPLSIDPSIAGWFSSR